LSDSAFLNFGADKDVTLKHVHNQGLLMSGTAGGEMVFFGDSGQYLKGDGSGNLKVVADQEVQLSGSSGGISADSTFNISVHDGSSKGLKLGGTLVTSTAAELNLVDGLTAGTIAASKAATVDGNKDVTGFRKVTATGAFIIGSAELDETDMEKLDGITNGTVAASKAVVADASKDVSGFRNITGTGALQTATFTATGNASVSGSLHVVGDLDVVGSINSVTKTVSILEVEDLNILCASGSNASAADGGGLLIGGYAKANSAASLTWDNDNSVIELGIAGSNEAVMSATAFSPASSDGMALGTTGLMWSDAFLASGGVINFDNGDVTMTHSANLLAIAGGNTRVDRLEIGGANDYIDVSTDLAIVASADIKLKPSGNDVVVDGAHVKPVDDGSYDLGADGTAWRTLFVDSLCPNMVSKTSNYTISATADFFVGVNTSSGAVTITLPDAGTAVKGKMYVIKDIGGKAGAAGKNITISPAGSDAIDGIAASRLLNTNHAAVNLISDGSDWFLW